MNMKLYELMALLMTVIGLTVGAFFFGMDYREAKLIEEQSKIDKAVIDTRKQAMEGAADAISKITVSNRTIQGKVETVVREVPVYRDCEHTPAVLQDINAVLTGRGPTGDRIVP